MKKKVEKWRSPSLGKSMELRIYGESGTPVLAIPTRGKGSTQWEDKSMIDAISFQLENGYNQLFCIASADDESFFNENITPGQRIIRHIQYESFVIEEVVPLIEEKSTIDFLIVAGVDMGGYHAINLGLKHPGSFGKAIGISGVYDISPFLDDYYDENIYYNNPMDYVPNLTKEKLLNKVREVDFRLVSYANDPRKDLAYRLNEVFKAKMMDSQLDVWHMQTEEEEEWDIWKQMFKIHIV